jgi:hypothetical protein
LLGAPLARAQRPHFEAAPVQGDRIRPPVLEVPSTNLGCNPSDLRLHAHKGTGFPTDFTPQRKLCLPTAAERTTCRNGKFQTAISRFWDRLGLDFEREKPHSPGPTTGRSSGALVAAKSPTRLVHNQRGTSRSSLRPKSERKQTKQG